MQITWVHIAIAILVVAILYLLFAYPKSDSVAPPIVRAPQAAAPSVPQPLQAIKQPLPPSVAGHKVRELTTVEDARLFLSSGSGVLLVYAPWCGHCKNMMPAFESASTKTDVPFARIEGQKAPAFMQEKEIRGFPTIFVNNKSNVSSKWQGGRDEGSMLAAAAQASA